MSIKWEKTKNSLERLLSSDKAKYLEHIEGVYYYLGRPIIGRDTSIDGGIYLSESNAEAIVVDSKKQPIISEFYSVIKKRVNWEKSKIERNGVQMSYDEYERLVLQSVYDFVKAEFVNGEKETDELVKRLGGSEDQKVGLEHFLKERTGVCKHRALTAGVLLELFKKEGLITGTVSVDRNLYNGEGHAWCRYTSQKGDVVIIDAGLGYFGLLKDIPEFYREQVHDYRRPEEMNN